MPVLISTRGDGRDKQTVGRCDDYGDAAFGCAVTISDLPSEIAGTEASTRVEDYALCLL